MATAKISKRFAKPSVEENIGVTTPSAIRRWPIVFFTALNELASNLVYVSLMEAAFGITRSGGPVGVVLVIQAGAQLLLGVWVGGIVDRIGVRKAATIGTISQALFAAVLAYAGSALLVYLLAFCLMGSRLLIIPSRLAIVRSVNSKKTLQGANVALETLAGLGLFVGPAIAAGLLLVTDLPVVPPLAAAAMFVLSAIPSMRLMPSQSSRNEAGPSGRKNVVVLTKSTWQFVKDHRAVRLLFVCVMHTTVVIAATMPLLTSLSRQLGLATEGTGVLVAAIGLGNLVGPALAPALTARLRTSVSIHLSALITPAAIIAVALLGQRTVVGAFVGLAFASLACAGLRVIANTVLQRVTPRNRQAALFGARQTVLGLGWFIAMAVVTAMQSVGSPPIGLSTILIVIGAAGLVMTIQCWVRHRREIHTICESADQMKVGAGPAS